MKLLRASLLLLPLALLPSAKSADVAGVPFCNVRAFGAAGDAKTLDSPGINKAIEACAELREEGRCICRPALT